MAFVRVMMLNGACGGATPASFTISSIVLEGADLFDISEASDGKTGILALKQDRALNYETIDSYTVGVKVTDGGGLFDTANVHVEIQNVNELPSVAKDRVSPKCRAGLQRCRATSCGGIA